MSNVTVIGVDLAKSIFQIHGVDANGKVVVKQKMARNQVVKFFANRPPCLVGMEACASSLYWARTIESLGHEVRRIHPAFIKPYLMASKNDANDAAAICEAVQRPRMRFVPNKTQEQSDIQAIHRVRTHLVKTKTATINQARGLLAENGVVFRQGAWNALKLLPVIIADLGNELSPSMRRLLAHLHEQITFLNAQIIEQHNALKSIVKEQEACRRLLQVPGLGLLGVTTLVSMAGVAKECKNGREFAAYLGLTPREHSSGGKQRLLGITKKGDSHLRTLLIHGARSVLRSLSMGGTPLGALTTWLAGIVERRGKNRASVALANKMARIAWSMLKYGSVYAAAA
jgi:transposase